MSSTLDFVEYVCEQMRGAGDITYKRMFGEYGVYCDGKIVGLICDNQLFVKITETSAQYCEDCEQAPPYEGAKPHYVIDRIDDRDWMTQLFTAHCRALPPPKPKKKKPPKAN